MSDFRYENVLLIDDNEINNFINSKLISEQNFAKNVEVKESGHAALNYLKEKSSKPDELPQVIFLDIMMPVMDGFEFLEEYEKLPAAVTKKCKIIMLSSSEAFKDLNRANSNPWVYKFLNKPLTEDVLEAIYV